MSRGGVRPGAGRKAEAGAKVTYTVRVTPATREILQAMRADGCIIGEILEAAARQWLRAKRDESDLSQ